jgi:hypothetical protein
MSRTRNGAAKPRAFVRNTGANMLSHLYKILMYVLERAERSRCNAYLASSVDIAELERRMRSSAFEFW